MASPACRLGRVLGLAAAALDRRPLLRHLPVALADHRADHPGRRPRRPGPRAVLQVAATIGVAALSWRFIEEPIRHGALGRWWRARAGDRAAAARSSARPARVAAVGRWPLASARRPGRRAGLAGRRCSLAAGRRPAAGPPPPASAAAPARRPARRDRPPGPDAGRARRRTRRPRRPPGRAPRAGGGPHRRLHLRGPDLAPTTCPTRGSGSPPSTRGSGVQHDHLEISGGTSIVETCSGQPNAHDVAAAADRPRLPGLLGARARDQRHRRRRRRLERRAWRARIQRMMSMIGNQPVHVGQRQVAGRHRAVLRAQHGSCGTRPCCRPAPGTRTCASTTGPPVVRNSWFIPDGIHYTSPGYAARARLIADALAAAFPSPAPRLAGAPSAAPGSEPGGQRPACLVH